MTFKLPAIVLVVIIAVVALGPLAVFVPRWQLCAAREACDTGSSARCRAPTSTKSGFINVPGMNPNFSLLPRAALSVTSARVTRRSNR
jgi:hypothetical protein